LASIVVINHNYGHFLESSLNSALNQQWRHLEVIVVDDGSQDNSQEVISRFGNRIKPIFKKNEGHTKAVNTGYEACSGDYILFLDADDLLYSAAISTSMALLRPGDIKIQFQLDTIDQDGFNMNLPFPYFQPGFSPEQAREQALVTGWYPWTTSSGNVYLREYLEKIFPLDINRIYRSPDSILNKLAPLYGAVRTLRQVLGAYRVHGKNSWASTASDWNPQIAVDWLKLNKEMEALFLELADQQNIPVRQPLVHPFQKLEYEIQVLRFVPHEPVVAQSLLATLVECFRWFSRAPWEPCSGRLARLVFLIFLAFAPKKLLKKILPKARGQKDRSSFWRLALGLTRRTA